MGNVTKDSTGKKSKNRNCKRNYKSNRRTKDDYQKEIREEIDAGKKSASGNDPMWYAQSPQLLKDAGSFSFNAPLGADITLHGDENCKDYTGVLPGIMTLSVAPTFGEAMGWNSAPNIAARRFYTFIRHANSGHANYDAPDLMLYLMAVDSVYSLIAYMNRIYGLLQVYSIKNRYYPAAIATAAGVDFDSFMQNAADFRYFMNQFTAKAASLCVPASFTFYRRHVQLYENVYLDAPNDKAQTYVFKPKFVYKFTYGGSIGSNRLEPLIMPEKASYTALCSIANEVLDAILLQEDFNIMSGDILKAYGQEGLYALAQVPVDYKLNVAYNPEIMQQIHNATVFSISDTDLNKWIIREYTDPGVYQGSLWANLPVTLTGTTNAWAYFDKLLDMHIDSPTPEDVMVATRLMACGSVLEEGKLLLDVVGSEVICAADMWFVDNKNNSVSHTTFENSFFTAAALGNWIKFNDAPILYSVSQDVETKKYSIDAIMGEVDNYTVIGQRELQRLHETALTSMLTAPTMSGLMAK